MLTKILYDQKIFKKCLVCTVYSQRRRRYDQKMKWDYWFWKVSIQNEYNVRISRRLDFVNSYAKFYTHTHTHTETLTEKDIILK